MTRRRIIHSQPRRTLGSLLHSADRTEVLRTFIHRFTMDHVPAWAREKRGDGSYYAPHFASDDEWLSNTSFAVKADGRLDARFSHCDSSGLTWPLGDSLTAPYRKGAA